MKKQFVRIALLTAFFVLLVCSVSAEEITHFVPEFDLDITIPSEYYAVTRDTPEDDPVFDNMGKSKQDIDRIMEANGIYLNAITPQLKEQICVSVIEGNPYDINTDSGLKSITSGLYDLFENYGHKVSYYEVYQHPQTRFLRVFFTAVNGLPSLQYLTVYDGEEYLFTYSAKETLTFEQEELMQAVVDSVVFDASVNRKKQEEVAEPIVQTEPLFHTDIETGVTFTVPAGWTEQPFAEERETLEIQFSSLKHPGILMSYYSMDAWEELAEEERAGYEREDVDQYLLTEAEIAKFLGIAEDKIKSVAYNGVLYYQAIMAYERDALAVNVSIDMTQVFHIEDGWIYGFQVIGTPEDEWYSDFESLLNSVEYPAPVVSDSSLPEKEEDEVFPGSMVLMLVGFLAVVALVAFLLGCVLEGKKKKAQMAKGPLPWNSEEKAANSICKNCGKCIPATSMFCPYCGERVQK